jgi:hypothetical protein
VFVNGHDLRERVNAELGHMRDQTLQQGTFEGGFVGGSCHSDGWQIEHLVTCDECSLHRLALVGMRRSPGGHPGSDELLGP